jgi:cytoskeleton protein RodZ
VSITERADERTDSSGPVGAQLRRARTVQGLSIEDVCQRTNIRPAVVHALENGDLEPSGGAVYARGHVRTLSHALDLDADALLANFDASYGAGMPRMPVLTPEPGAPRAADRVSRRSEPLSPAGVAAPDDALATRAQEPRGPRWSWVMAVVLVAVIIVALVQLLVPAGKSSPKSPQAAAPSAAAKPTPTTTVPSLLFPVPAEGVTLRIVLTTKPSWLEISDERGVKLIAQVVQPSSKPLDLHAAGGLNATFGDASAVSLSCNGHPLGPIGAPNQVVTLILSRGTVQCPAA